MCSLPAPDAGLTLFVATPNPLCPSTINLPQSGWFESDDGTSDAGTLIDATSTPGCAGANDCSYHFKGSGYTGWGALVGFNTSTTAADGGVVPDGVAASYTGFQFWLMGTSAGTRTSGYVAANNSVKVIFPTTTNRNEDDYAYYCPTEGDAGNGWVFCQIPFSSLKRDGFSSTPPVATDMFDVANLTKVEFQLAAYQAADGAVPTPVSFDLRLDDIAFY
jgi:hypothetical protein